MEYLLVRFIGDDILHIVPTKKVSTINEELLHAPYKRMGYYEARPIEYSDDKNYLEKKKEVLEEQASEDNRNEEHHEDSDDSVKDPDYEPEEGRTEIYKDNRNEEHHEDSDDSVKDPDYEPEEGRTEIYKDNQMKSIMKIVMIQSKTLIMNQKREGLRFTRQQ
ncbi:unnamed protein product [Callosobruchus maculatus]|uniref:Uncharacterized protein n=1 Tax=Callosobruchus maculatus TaxID=64391 RepID=A0A653DGQ8_CALMS|nr:unnamed protein product [Callosobruchus maculatus]